jgi:hypothetical protein
VQASRRRLLFCKGWGSARRHPTRSIAYERVGEKISWMTDVVAKAGRKIIQKPFRLFIVDISLRSRLRFSALSVGYQG